jgi:hypothetical protein
MGTDKLTDLELDIVRYADRVGTITAREVEIEFDYPPDSPNITDALKSLWLKSLVMRRDRAGNGEEAFELSEDGKHLAQMG